ncbi:MAG: N-acetyltransferase [Bradyrhizobiaceae bacterium]|nr:N-acetyltransferase [Bradyrhizobiaceae bacterium]
MSTSTLLLHEEAAADWRAIDRLHEAAFNGRTESDLVQALRRERAVVLSLVAEEDGRIAGHALYSRVTIEIGSESVPALALAPLAVAPERQRRGIGSRLVREAHRRLAAQGEGMVFVVGDPAYYERLGFSKAAARPFQTPYDGPHVMALALNRGVSASGVVRYPAAFAEVG